jgi:hypothetical protein
MCHGQMGNAAVKNGETNFPYKYRRAKSRFFGLKSEKIAKFRDFVLITIQEGKIANFSPKLRSTRKDFWKYFRSSMR